MIEFLKYTYCIDYWLLENSHDTILFEYSKYSKKTIKNEKSEILTLTDWLIEKNPKLFYEFKHYIVHDFNINI